MRNAIIAEALRELAAGQDEQTELLHQVLEGQKQIRQAIVTLADGLAQHQHATRDAVDRLGTRVLSAEHRLAALEKAAPNVR